MRNKLAPNLALVLLTVVLVSIIILAVPDKALEILPAVIVSTAFVVLIIWRSDFDAKKKDERTIQLMGYGARNAFIFLLFAMPWLAAYHVLGIIVLDAAIALCILWILSIGITWLTFLYYYTR
ncbi:MAG: hypothetical protein RTV41_09695 [Candidatus Thorarchaeota archaeon]